MFFRILILILLAVFSATTCHGENMFTPADYFLLKHPEQRKIYIALFPTSYKALEESAGREWACQVSLLNKLIDKFGEIEEVYTYLNAYKNHSNKNFIEEREAIKEFKKTILKDDYLYEFHYDDGKVQQSGLIILNNGEIRRREVYHTTSPAE